MTLQAFINEKYLATSRHEPGLHINIQSPHYFLFSIQHIFFSPFDFDGIEPRNPTASTAFPTQADFKDGQEEETLKYTKLRTASLSGPHAQYTFPHHSWTIPYTHTCTDTMTNTIIPHCLSSFWGQTVALNFGKNAILSCLTPALRQWPQG